MPHSAVHNIIIGKLYIDTQGKVVITNHKTGDYCEFEFKPWGWKINNSCYIEGIVKNKEGIPFYKI